MVQNATTDLSTRLKHIENVYKVVINLLRKARSDTSDQLIHILPYHMHFETNGIVDYIGTLFSNEVVCLSVLFVRNMDTPVATRGCPGI